MYREKELGEQRKIRREISLPIKAACPKCAALDWDGGIHEEANAGGVCDTAGCSSLRRERCRQCSFDACNSCLHVAASAVNPQPAGDVSSSTPSTAPVTADSKAADSAAVSTPITAAVRAPVAAAASTAVAAAARAPVTAAASAPVAAAASTAVATAASAPVAAAANAPVAAAASAPVAAAASAPVAVAASAPVNAAASRAVAAAAVGANSAAQATSSGSTIAEAVTELAMIENDESR